MDVSDFLGMETVIVVLVFLAGCCVFFVIALPLVGDYRSIRARLGALTRRREAAPRRSRITNLARSALPHIARPLLPQSEQARSRLQTRLVRAGLYSRQAMALFLGVKMLLIALPAAAGLILGLLNVVRMQDGLLGGLVGGIAGMIAPGFWLDSRKKKRQINLRRALPDALDMLVICLEGGVSLPGAFRCVTAELETAHPLLAAEMNVIQREMQMGLSPGEALRRFADRSDVEEVVSLASAVVQAERYGASLARSFRLHADMLRVKRLQRAEEMAQKAAVKVLFPSLLCIFPAIFLVILGPAVMQMWEMLDKMKK